jgi:excisionase family DNA binding protein
MIRRNGQSVSVAAQLSLPYENINERGVSRQLEPLTVRIPDAIRLTGICRSKLYELIASGDLETIKLGRSTLIPVDSLKGLIERARAGLL